MHIHSTPALSRRHFLRGSGAALLGLPFLEAMVPTFAQAAPAQSPQRFVAMCATLGFHTPFLVPEKAGEDYALTPYLERIKSHRDDFTVFSGLSHPQQQGNNGHASELTWLTSAQRPGLAGFRNTISLDQLIAEKVGTQTRYPYLALSNQGSSLSWSSNGVAIPGQRSPSRLFKALFIEGTEKEIEAEMRGLKRGKSILDTVRTAANTLDRKLGRADREKLDEYLTSVRDLEARLQQSEGWVTKPKPKVDAVVPKDVDDRNDAIGKQRLMNDMIVLALQTDSTRTVTYHLSGMNAVPSNIDGVKTDWHNLSHHGKDEKKIAELRKIEEAEFDVLNDFLTKLSSIPENGERLLDHTSVLYGSNLGNASAHDWRNLPIVVAGGGFKHAGHIAGDPNNNIPFANLLVQLAQQSGLETAQFGTSTEVGIPGFG
ncbi:DUF1552 domain-containing protein [Verrucomicrobiales bacterium]|nr:DUF1552 domain-containing protein [bacterium]MDC0503884.1 DUF1552 domain-containing protein [Verrucomicrobiales bacterium]MDF1786677.1 DUF1552 domain-containing protein [Verrucomicrobiales bacterium]